MASTQKSDVIEETKAQVRLRSDQHEAMDVAFMRENEKHYKAVEGSCARINGTRASSRRPRKDGLQTADELLLGDPDKELGDPSKPATKRCRGDESGQDGQRSASDLPGLEEKIAPW